MGLDHKLANGSSRAEADHPRPPSRCGCFSLGLAEGEWIWRLAMRVSGDGEGMPTWKGLHVRKVPEIDQVLESSGETVGGGRVD